MAEDIPIFEHYSVDKGLSSSTVFSILQDDGGFMWFGTINGLNRYDGYQFKVFEYDPEDSTTISNNSAGNIYKDHQGYIWAGTWGGGLNRFDPKTNTAVRYEHNPDKPGSISGNRVQCIFEDSKQRIWAGTYANGLNLLDPKTNQFIHFKKNPLSKSSLSNNRVWCITEDQSGNLWIGTSDGLNRLNPETGEINIYFTNDQDKNSLSHNTVRSVLFSKRKELWVGTENGLNRFDFNDGHFDRYFYQNATGNTSNQGRINSIMESRTGHLWIGTGYGVLKLDPSGLAWQRYTSDPSRPASLGDTEIRCIFEDRFGILWFGTRGRGFDKYNPNHKKFKNLTFSSSPEQASKENTIFSISQFGNELYLNNFTSLLRYNLKSGKLVRRTNLFGSSKGMDENRKRTIYHSKIDPSIFWISVGADVSRYNLVTEEVRNYELPEKTETDVPYKRVIAIYEQSKKYLWLGNFQGGLRKIDTESGKVVKHYYHIEGDTTSISHNEIWFIEPDVPGFLWIGTGKGLNLLDIKNGTFRHYFFDRQAKHSRRLFTFFKDPRNIIWLGTDYGLLRFDPIKHTYTNYTKQQGLPDNQINGIRQDSQGHLWLSTGNGLAKFDPETNHSTNFSVDDGLLNQEYLPGSIFQNEQGEIFIGGMKGLDYFLPEQININTQIPPVVLTDIKILNKKVKIGPGQPLAVDIAYSTNISLSAKDYFFSLEFAALDYANSARNSYAYKLEGFDKDWIYTNSVNRIAAYTTLPGGDYTFKVKGSNADGIWNEQGAAFLITIVPPFWKTSWFRVLFVLILIGLILLIIKIRTTSIKNRSLELQHINHRLNEQIVEREKVEAEKEKLHAQLLQSQKMEALGTLAGGVAHDFNNLLTVINGHTEFALMQKTIDSTQKRHFVAIQDSSKRAEELTRQLLAFGRKQLVHAKILNINDTIKKTEMMLRRLIPEDIHIQMELATSVPFIKADPSQIDQILMNLIINARDAIQYQRETQLEKRIIIKTRFVEAADERISPYFETRDTAHIMLSVTDSGVGIDENLKEHLFEPFFTTKDVSKGTGLGLATVYGIVRQNGGNIFVNSQPGKGSTFQILWPVTREVAPAETTEVETPKDLHGSERILLVEDDRAVREFAADIFEKFGYKIQFAENGVEALQKFESAETPFDLIVTDLIMPQMNGMELIEKLDGRIDLSKVLYVSGYTFDYLSKEGNLRNDIQFLQKPYSVNTLIGKVRDILDDSTTS